MKGKRYIKFVLLVIFGTRMVESAPDRSHDDNQLLDLETGLPPVDESTHVNPQADDSISMCDPIKNFYVPYDGKECPPGTWWNEKEGCCDGCPLCAPGWRQSHHCRGGCIPCEQFYFSSNPENNKMCFPCTNCTSLNRHTFKVCKPFADAECGECFWGHAHLDGTGPYMSRCIQIKQVKTAPDVQCDQSKGYFLVPHNGICPPGTGIDVYTQCCLSCRKCTPGYQHAENCLKRCQPCPKDTFSDQAVNNPVCHHCLNCHALNRLYEQACHSTADAKCGTCMFGYYEDVHNTEISCLKCQPGNTEPQCEEYLHGHQGETSHEDASVPSWVIGTWVTAVLTCLIFVAGILILCQYTRKKGIGKFKEGVGNVEDNEGENLMELQETRMHQIHKVEAFRTELELVKQLLQDFMKRNTVAFTQNPVIGPSPSRSASAWPLYEDHKSISTPSDVQYYRNF